MLSTDTHRPRVACARAVRSFFQRIMSGEQDVVYDGEAPQGFLYHSHLGFSDVPDIVPDIVPTRPPRFSDSFSDALADPLFRPRNSV
jgi:hypothetical protein